MEYKKDLIFDIGLHKGEDTINYLKNGYRVLAVEANPRLVEYCNNKFRKAIANGQLTILNVGIGAQEGTFPFYINLKQSEWSSFNEGIGARDNSDFEVVEIPCITTNSLFKKYGVPYYMKVDIEGNDFLCLNDIEEKGIKPSYVSCEGCHLEWLRILRLKGYTRFKIINQGDRFKPLVISEQRNFWYRKYQKFHRGLKKLRKMLDPDYGGASSSGPFAENTKGSWKTFEEVERDFLEFQNLSNHGSWIDFHAAL